ncbi:hypothetical protein D3C79_328340 [compost metagenome]
MRRAGQRLGVYPVSRAVEHRHHQLVHLIAMHVGNKALVDADIVNLLAVQLVEGVEVVAKTVDDQLAASLLQLVDKWPADGRMLE